MERLNIDKSSWTKVKFGDIAIQQKESVDRENTDLVNYVKGEHMGSEDLHLREWGILADEYLGPAFIRKFSKGDVLYGSRRTYLRKVVVSSIDGITSNTTFVVKANEEKMLKELLPFIMLSEGFAENSIKNSKGSVNPYINWKDIAKYEFLLPPKDEQAKLSKLLWAMDDVIEKERSVLEKLEVFNEVFANDLMGLSKSEIQDWKKMPLKDVAPLQRGFDLTNKKLVEGEFPVGYSNGIKFYHNEFKVEGPGVWTGRSGTIGNVFYTEDNYWPHNTALWVTDFKGNHPKFIYHLYSKLHFEKRMTGTGVPTLNRNDIHKFKIHLPEYSEQLTIADRIDEIDRLAEEALRKISSSQSLQKSIINEIF